jgi:prolipoprotein diacylglyceryltransferase
MNNSHWYGIAFLGGAILGFFVIVRQSNTAVDSLYNSGWHVLGGQ